MEQGPLWYVRLEGEEIRVWTLDQLDAAYRASLVDDATLVRTDNAGHWNTLGALLAEEPRPSPPSKTGAPTGIPWARVPNVAAPLSPDASLQLLARRRPLRWWALVGVALAAAAVVVGVHAGVVRVWAHLHPPPVVAASMPAPPSAPAAPSPTLPAVVAPATVTPASLPVAESSRAAHDAKAKGARAPHRRHVAATSK